MKIKIDYANKAIIVTGTVYGKRIKGLSLVHGDDEFDLEFGIKLALAKFKASKYWAKAMVYEKRIRENNKVVIELKKENIQLSKFYDYTYEKSCEFDSVVGEMLEERFNK